MIAESLRRRPETPAEWLGPLPVPDWFGDPARPLEIDVGCGKGRFLLARAGKFPDVNFLGIDRMLRRIRKIDNRARRLDLDNVRLVRMEAYYAVSYWIPAGAVRTYYVWFPDPWPKARHERHRLFNPLFLDALHRTLEPGGAVHVATDHAPYFEQLAEIFAADARFSAIAPFVPEEDERTDFECFYLGQKTIGRLSVVKA